MHGASQLAPYLVMQLAVQVSKLCTKAWNAMIGLMLSNFHKIGLTVYWLVS